MLKTRILATVAIVALSASQAAACTEADVLAKQGALIAAVEALVAVNPAKAQALVAQMQTEMAAAAAAGDDAAVCVMMDRLTVEAAG
jgi:hypothetical protein